MRQSVNGISVNYEVHGDGEWLTLVHGAIDNLNAWYNQVPAFSKHYRVLTYDTRGHGKTDLSGDSLSTELLVEDLHELLRSLDIKKTMLLGRSMGGAIALRYALMYPDMVEKLILSDYAIAPDKRDPKPVNAGSRQPKLKDDAVVPSVSEIVDARISRVFTPGFAQENPEVAAKYKLIALQNDQQIYLKKPEKSAKGLTPDLTQIACPTLIIMGLQDTFFGVEAAKKMNEIIPDSKLEIVSAGHAAFIENPNAYNERVLSFLMPRV